MMTSQLAIPVSAVATRRIIQDNAINVMAILSTLTKIMTAREARDLSARHRALRQLPAVMNLIQEAVKVGHNTCQWRSNLTPETIDELTSLGYVVKDISEPSFNCFQISFE
jgi:hypothetical protein